MLFECDRLSEARARHAEVLQGSQSVAELMKAAYDESRVGGLMHFALDIVQSLGQRH